MCPCPTITADPGTEVCDGQAVTLDAGAGYTTYLWSPGGETESITAEELCRQIEAGEALTILDVRSAGEFQAGHLAGAVHIPFKEVEDRAAEIPGGEGDRIVVYCGLGPRAVWAAKTLRGLGRGDLVMLEGHFSGWKKAGFPVEA